MKYFYSVFAAPFCFVVFVVGRKGLVETNLYLNQKAAQRAVMPQWSRDDYGLQDIWSQFAEYFGGTRQNFDIELDINGTKFQKRVWQALREIPFGETRSYKQIGEMIGNDRAARAVGMANSRNPLPVVVPCHRVIATDGSLGGFSSGVELKEKLLHFEWQQKDNNAG